MDTIIIAVLIVIWALLVLPMTLLPLVSERCGTRQPTTGTGEATASVLPGRERHDPVPHGGAGPRAHALTGS